MQNRNRQKGAALVLTLILLAVASAWACGLCAMTTTNLQVAKNHQMVNRALRAAESGFQVIRYHLSHITISSSTPPSEYFDTIVADLSTELKDSQISIDLNGSIPDITLDSATDERFSVTMKMDDTNSKLLVAVTGKLGQKVTRTVEVEFAFSTSAHPIFKYGFATKGPIDFKGNPTTTSVTANWEADIYTESSKLTPWDVAVHLEGNTNFDGDINIGSDALFEYEADLLIAGEQGETAVENHVMKNVGSKEFPLADTARFVKYADPDSGAIIDASTDLSKGMTLINRTIAANTNPVFRRGVIIEGILLIETPNIVTFDNVDLRGIIVGHGSDGNPSTNQLNFTSNFASTSYPCGEAFDAIRKETGTALLTPGFAANFMGNFSAIGGVVAINGLYINGNASASVAGSIINYSESKTTIEGNLALNFDRARITEAPAGFEAYKVLAMDGTSYSIDI
ncbi:pilus assembly PilX N-terminal domain-containing protein [Planctomycetota bacterium]